MKDEDAQKRDKDLNQRHRHKLKSSAVTSKKIDVRYALILTFSSFAMSMLLTFLASTALVAVGYILSFTLLLAFIVINVLFDIVGMATASAVEAPFHSMASRRVAGAFEALYLIRRADKVSNFCNDVVGDITGIISGSTAAVIVTNMSNDFSIDVIFTQLLISGVVAGLTVGGKAAGKSLAINYNTRILYMCGRIFHIVRKLIKRRG